MPVDNLSILFCEDVREEGGGKSSIMGLLAQRLLVPEVPSVLSQLCIVLLADVAGEDTVAVKCKISSDAGLSLPPELDADVSAIAPGSDWSIKVVLALQNLAVPAPAEITVDFSVGGKRIGRMLKITAEGGVQSRSEKVAAGIGPHSEAPH